MRYNNLIRSLTERLRGTKEPPELAALAATRPELLNQLKEAALAVAQGGRPVTLKGVAQQLGIPERRLTCAMRANDLGGVYTLKKLAGQIL